MKYFRPYSTKIIILLFVFVLMTPVLLSSTEQSARFSVQFSPSRINWNPHYAYTTTEAQIFTALHEGLVSYHPATLRPIPGAAESWVISEDGLRITFTLRQNLRWSNGRQITSSDFKESWLTILSPKTAAEYASLLDDISGAKEYRSGNGPAGNVDISTPNPRTLVVGLKHPSPQFLSIICHYSFAPIHKDFREIEDWSANRSVPVSGPYIIRARSGEDVLLDKNPMYWDAESVHIDGLRLVFRDNPEAVMKEFNRYELDWVVSGMDNSQLAIAQALNISPLFSTTYFYFSNRGPVWSDGRIRRALALLLPWDDIRGGRLIPGTSLVPPIPNYPAADAQMPAAGERSEEALRLLEEAGYPEGKGLPKLVIRIPIEDPVSLQMKETWEREIGVSVILDIRPFPDYYDSLKTDGYDMATLTWTGDYADPHTFLAMWESGSSFNDAEYNNPDFDQILAEAAILPHLQRLTKLREAEELLLRWAQVLPIEHFPSVNLIDLRFVEGWYPNALDIHPFKSIIPKLGFDIPGVVMSSKNPAENTRHLRSDPFFRWSSKDSPRG